MLKWTTVSLIVVVGGCLSAWAQTIEWNVTTDRLVYLMGDHVTFSTEACNTGMETVTIDINVAPLVIDSQGEGVFGFTLLPWVIMVDIPPGECSFAGDQLWTQEDNLGPVQNDQVPPGWYRGEIFGSTSAPFEIQAPAAVPISPWAVSLLILAVGVAGFLALRRASV